MANADRIARIGMVGCGYMGQKAHLDNLVTIPGCRVVALAEGRSETAKLVARKYGIERVYPDHRALLSNAEVDAVVCVMHYGLHHTVARDILEAGKHLLTEKPIAIRSETGHLLADLAEAKGVIYQVGYMKRHVPASRAAVETIRRWRESGAAGAMNYLRVSMPPGNWTYGIEGPIGAGDSAPAYQGQAIETPPDWMGAATGEAYNAFVNYFIHQVNMVRYLLGESYRCEYLDPTGTVLLGRSDSGVPWVLEMKGYNLRDHWEEYYKVCFEGGKLDLSIPAPMARQHSGDLRIYHGPTSDVDRGRYEQPVLAPSWCMLEQARHFVDCVRTGKPTLAPAREAALDLEVAEQYARLLTR
ncbi:MAG: Gfo/Idh/MocA family oxidoreductase [Phycisphaerae bacterium]|nr:Gfo/Idh/MocA family oxidoreductase [Phycisphaerae bacterium]